MRNKGINVGVQLGLVLVTAVLAAALPEPEVNTTFGPIKGVWLETKEGDQIAGFLGLPYAEPPVGELRFENPQPWTKNWTSVFNAMTDGSACLQIEESGNLVGDEDCLCLNVFTPTLSKVKNATANRKLPVMVFLHGGGFNKGSSNSSLFAPTYLLDHDIVLVTLNFRLNALGFFSTGSRVAPGNYALKDVVVALKWINKNIANFGGDSKSVTLFGASSGAIMAQILASNKITEGLFHKLITMSGSTLSAWAVHGRENIRKESLRLAKLAGCDSSSEDMWSDDEVKTNVTTTTTTRTRTKRIAKKITIEEMDGKVLECLKKANASEIVRNSNHAIWHGNPLSIFGPTLEAEAEGAVLTVHPAQSLREGLFRDLPWMTGVVNDEGLIKAADIFLNSQMKAELIKNFENLLIPYVLEMGNVFDNNIVVTKLIEKFYFNNSLITNFDSNITQLIGDASSTWASYDFLRKQITKTKSNAYFYLFSYEGTFSNTFRWGYPFRFGVAHNDDLNYLFPYLNKLHADLRLNNSISDMVMINVMCEMWTNFAKTGVPSARLTVDWEPYQKNHRYMKLGNRLMNERSMQSDFLPERMAFWSELMANYSLPIKEYRVNDGGSKSKNGATSHTAEKVLCVFITILMFWWSSMF